MYWKGDIKTAGLIPYFLREDDPRPAREQIAERYAHGGGWNPIKSFKMNEVDRSIQYPGDPRMRPLAVTQLRDETILVYRSGWTAIVQKDGKFEISRLD